MDKIEIFFQDLPNHKLYGYGDLNVGEMCEVDLIKHNKTPREIQTFVHAYGQYTTQKKFKTKALNNILYIKRIK
jgi:hypothetical protein